MPPKRAVQNTSNSSSPSPSCSADPQPLSLLLCARATLAPGVPPLPGGGGGVFKAAAAAVLRAEKRYLSTGEITR